MRRCESAGCAFIESTKKHSRDDANKLRKSGSDVGQFKRYDCGAGLSVDTQFNDRRLNDVIAVHASLLRAGCADSEVAMFGNKKIFVLGGFAPHPLLAKTGFRANRRR